MSCTDPNGIQEFTLCCNCPGSFPRLQGAGLMTGSPQEVSSSAVWSELIGRANSLLDHQHHLTSCSQHLQLFENCPDALLLPLCEPRPGPTGLVRGNLCCTEDVVLFLDLSQDQTCETSNFRPKGKGGVRPVPKVQPLVVPIYQSVFKNCVCMFLKMCVGPACMTETFWEMAFVDTGPFSQSSLKYPRMQPVIPCCMMHTSRTSNQTIALISPYLLLHNHSSLLSITVA